MTTPRINRRWAFVLAGACALGFALPTVRPAEPDKPDKIKALQEKRITVLKEILDVTEKTYKGGQAGFDQVAKARLDLLQAQLDASQTKEARVRLLEEMVKQAEVLEETVKRQAEAKQVGRVDVLKAQAFVLETKIALERAKAATP